MLVFDFNKFNKNNNYYVVIPTLIFIIFIIFSTSSRILIALKNKKELLRKKGIYFSLFLPMVYEQKDLQLVLDKAHLLMDLPEISSWEKVEVALKLKKAEQAITLARSYIKKYDPNLLSS